MVSPDSENLHSPFAHAFWIWPGVGLHDLQNCFAQFRRPIELDAVPATARCFVTADQKYRLRVNGENVCRGPARGYQRSWPYDEVDIAPYLRTGINVITVRAYTIGRSTFSYRSEGFAGFLFSGEIGDLSIVSDASWRCRREPGIRRDTVPLSLQLDGHQEWVDLRESTGDWEAPDYDDSAWEGSELFRPYNSMPYYSLEPRSIPNLEESVLHPTCCEESEGVQANGWESARDLAAFQAQEVCSWRRLIATQGPVSVPATETGCFRSYLFDLGRVDVGALSIQIKGSAGGETIDCLYSEILDAQTQRPLVDVGDHSRVRLASRMICRAKVSRHRFFHLLGFRYVLVTVRNNPAALELSVCVESSRYPMNRIGAFQFSDVAICRIWEACAHTQEICSLDAYVDTPWREQAQWWGDARIQSWNTFYLSGDVGLLRRGIRILAGQLSPDGLTYGHAPTIAHHCILPDFSLIWILTLWDDYWQTGETQLFEKHLPTVVGILRYFKSHTDPETGLVSHDSRYWLFLDWNDLQKEGQPALLNLWLLHTLQKIVEMGRVASINADWPPLLPWIRELSASINRHLLTDGGLISDGWIKGRGRSGKTSVHCQTLAWLCGLEGLNRERALREVLLPWLKEDRVTHAPPVRLLVCLSSGFIG